LCCSFSLCGLAASRSEVSFLFFQLMPLFCSVSIHVPEDFSSPCSSISSPACLFLPLVLHRSFPGSLVGTSRQFLCQSRSILGWMRVWLEIQSKCFRFAFLIPPEPSLAQTLSFSGSCLLAFNPVASARRDLHFSSSSMLAKESFLFCRIRCARTGARVRVLLFSFSQEVVCC
jgi:hypothetical protein